MISVYYFWVVKCHENKTAQYLVSVNTYSWLSCFQMLTIGFLGQAVKSSAHIQLIPNTSATLLVFCCLKVETRGAGSVDGLLYVHVLSPTSLFQLCLRIISNVTTLSYIPLEMSRYPFSGCAAGSFPHFVHNTTPISMDVGSGVCG